LTVNVINRKSPVVRRDIARRLLPAPAESIEPKLAELTVIPAIPYCFDN
jgi:hypothetical protein